MSHQFDPTILRAYDVRGTVGKNLGPADALALGQAFGTQLAENGQNRVAVGRDGRLSSPQLAEALRTGLMSAGMTVFDVGIGPTPLVYFATHSLGVDAGIMVTGSHNKPQDNGFKMCGRKGQPIYGASIEELGTRANKGNFAEAQGAHLYAHIGSAYLEQLAQVVPADSDLHVVWDPGNGGAADYCTRLCALLPGTHHVINGTVDGRFPNHHPDPTVPKNLRQLKQEVARQGADFGVAFDGDGDRIGVVDAAGNILAGDDLLLLYARDLLPRHPGATIIGDVKCSDSLFDGVRAAGGRAVMGKTGHSLIKKAMRATKAALAGEMSGHIFFADEYYGFDDALYAAVRLMRLVHESGFSLRQLAAQLPAKYATPEMRLACAEEDKARVIEALAQQVEQDGFAADRMDGIRVRCETGWWLVRASNTEAALILRAEGISPVHLNDLLAYLQPRLAAQGIALNLPEQAPLAIAG